MDYFDENENTYLKSSSVHNKRRIKDKKLLKNKDNKETIFSPSIIIMIMFVLLRFVSAFQERHRRTSPPAAWCLPLSFHGLCGHRGKAPQDP